MQLFLFQILEVKNYGVKLVCLAADGTVHFIDKPYTPYFYAVNMPVRYRRDIKKCTVETSAGERERRERPGIAQGFLA